MPPPALVLEIYSNPAHFQKISSLFQFLRLAFDKGVNKYHRQCLIDLLLKPSEFERLKKTIPELWELIQKFPTYKVAIGKLLSKKENFQNLVQKMEDVRYLMAYFPDYKVAFCRLIIEIPEVCQKVVHTKNDVWNISSFPDECRNIIIPHILHNLSEYQRLITTMAGLTELTRRFTAYAEDFIKPILTHPDEYRRLIKHGEDLADLLRHFPQHAERLIKPLLEDHQEYQRVIQEASDLVAIAKQCAAPLAEALIQPVLEKKTEYQRLIDEGQDLARLSKQFTHHTDRLMQPLLDDEAEYQRVIQDAEDLLAVAEQYPHYAERFIQPVLTSALEYWRIMRHAPRKSDMKDGWDSSRRLFELTNSSMKIPNILEFKKDKKYRWVGWKLLAENAEYHIALVEREEYERKKAEGLVVGESERYTPEMSALLALVRHFPQHKEALLKPVLEDIPLYQRMVTSATALLQLAYLRTGDMNFYTGGGLRMVGRLLHYHKHYKVLLTPLLENIAIFRQVILNTDDLKKLLEKFPAYRRQLVRPLLNDTLEYQRVIKNARELLSLIYTKMDREDRLLIDPSDAEGLIQPLLEDLEEFYRLTQAEQKAVRENKTQFFKRHFNPNPYIFYFTQFHPPHPHSPPPPPPPPLDASRSLKLSVNWAIVQARLDNFQLVEAIVKGTDVELIHRLTAILQDFQKNDLSKTLKTILYYKVIHPLQRLFAKESVMLQRDDSLKAALDTLQEIITGYTIPTLYEKSLMAIYQHSDHLAIQEAFKKNKLNIPEKISQDILKPPPPTYSKDTLRS